MYSKGHSLRHIMPYSLLNFSEFGPTACLNSSQNSTASCTLEAGVKIYSMRVDSVHSEAYKVLGGINRVGQDLEQG
ncbi:hypothetical protein L6452_28484 [Arctium lappa]|uniref:Uncharacterized protein n=1 Tax=Arctium lappa TaxID=4217 RepID=A0ACB8ZYT2_ARCLA|nr:hypothetical protein L6452_28484 [Arctium lappa]